MAAPAKRIAAVLAMLVSSMLLFEKLRAQDQTPLPGEVSSAPTADCALSPSAQAGLGNLSQAHVAAGMSGASLIKFGAMGGLGQPQPAAWTQVALLCSTP